MEDKKTNSQHSVGVSAEFMDRANALVPSLKKKHPYVPFNAQAVIRMAAGLGLEARDKKTVRAVG